MTKDGFTYAIEALPWQECARLIQSCNARNRPITERRVETIARSMKQDRFFTIHQGIALDPSGQVIDGQHRLMAAARAKRELRILVCRYTDARLAEEAMAIFDSGRMRSTADGLAIGGVMPTEDAKAMTATVNAMVTILGPHDGIKYPKLDVQEVGEFYKANREAIRWSIAHIPARRGGAFVRGSFAIAWRSNPGSVAELAAQIAEGTCLPGSAAALWNRAFADGLLTPTKRSDGLNVAWRALRIIKVHVCGEKPPVRLHTSDEALRWFVAAKSAVPPVAVSEATGTPVTINDQILRFLPADGASIGDIAKSIGKPYNNTTTRLQRLVERGLVVKSRPGFYVPAKAAA